MWVNGYQSFTIAVKFVNPLIINVADTVIKNVHVNEHAFKNTSTD